MAAKPSPNASDGSVPKCRDESPTTGRRCGQDQNHGDDHTGHQGSNAANIVETWPNSSSN